MAQAVSRRHPTAEARVRLGPVHVGFVVDKVALGQVLSQVLRFSPVNFIPLLLFFLSPIQPRKALRAPGGRGSQVFRQSAHEDGKVVSRTHRPPLPPKKDSWYSFLLEAESTPGPQCDRNDYVSEEFQ
jgi:hypothetical protein